MHNEIIPTANLDISTDNKVTWTKATGTIWKGTCLETFNDKKSAEQVYGNMCFMKTGKRDRKLTYKCEEEK